MKTLTLLLVCFMMANISLAQTNKKVIKAYFLDQKVKATLICSPTPVSPEEADAQAIMNIHEALMVAEKEIKLLDINLLLSAKLFKTIPSFLVLSQRRLLIYRLQCMTKKGFRWSLIVTLS